jgi:hypothetical protein
MVMHNPFFKRFHEFILAPSHSRTISALVILIIAAAVPLTVLVAQQQQQTQQHAAGNLCTVLQSNGKYLVGGACSGSTLYTCNGTGGSTGSTICAYGCQVNSGAADTCKAAPTPTPIATPVSNCTEGHTQCVNSGSYIKCISGAWSSKYVCSTGTSCQTTNDTSNPCKTISAGSPCTVLQSNGKYLVGGACSGSTLYTCNGTGGSTGSTTCAYGCQVNSGAADTCKAAPTPTPIATPVSNCTEGHTQCVNSGSYIKCISGAWSSKYVCSTGTSCQTTNDTSNPCKTISAGSPCTVLQSNGKYLVGGACSGSTLYTCNGTGGSTGSTTCAYGCQVNSGAADTCKAAPTPTPTSAPTCIAGTGKTNSACGGSQYDTYQCNGASACEKYTYACRNTPASCVPGPNTSVGIALTLCPLGSVCNPKTCNPTCGTGQTCNGQTGQCENTNCKTCASLGFECGTVSDGCGATLHCGVDSAGNVPGDLCNPGTGLTCVSNKCVQQTYACGANNTCVAKAGGAFTENTCGGTCNNICNGGPLINCNSCQPALAACGVGNGTQTCQYSTFNGSTNCTSLGTVNNVCDLAVCPSPTATPTPTPSGSPTPTPTPIPGHTMLAFTIGMDGVGSAGDNVNPNPSSSNQAPGHTTRNLDVQIFDNNNSQVFTQTGSINYNSGSGVFTGTVDLGANFANGNYTVKVKSDGHLRKLIPGIQNFSSSLAQPIQLPQVNLVAGDVDSNNLLDLGDYNILLSCITSPFVANIDNHVLCNTNADYLRLSDLEDNGVVNEFDYNLFLREYAVQNGD